MRNAILTVIISGLCIVSSAEAQLVVGTFDSTRSTTANLAAGSLTTQSRSSLFAHFPGSSYATAPTLTPQFLAGVKMVAIVSDNDEFSAITPLSAGEQSALLNFVQSGGSAFIGADTYDFSTLLASQSMVSPFGLTIADDGHSGYLSGHPINTQNPITNGPFGQNSSLILYGAGVFTGLGSHAIPIATETVTGLPVIAIIPPHALGPTSGPVVLFTDTTFFADSPIGFFQTFEPMFLNTIEYLTVPEPSGFVLAALGFVGLMALGRRRWKR